MLFMLSVVTTNAIAVLLKDKIKFLIAQKPSCFWTLQIVTVHFKSFKIKSVSFS